MPSAPDHLIVALDQPDADAALGLVRRLSGLCHWYKIGLELFTACGPGIISAVRAAGGRVFLDLKMHDIPETVSRAVAAAAGLGVELLTVHAAGGGEMVRRAVHAAPGVRVLGVTVLTSLDQPDLAAAGVDRDLAEVVELRARLCQAAGAAGVVASPREAARLRATLGPGFLIVTPGIRAAAWGGSPGFAGRGGRSPCGAPPDDDQNRTGTAHQALLDGADMLVVGRPVRDASDPRAAAAELLGEIAAALSSRDAHG